MKYSKELYEKLKKIPSNLQEVSLNYKAWKKRCKISPDFSGEAVVALKTECERIESTFNRYYLGYVQPSWKQCFACSKSSEMQPDILLMFAEINATTLYKICKRLQKRYVDPMPMQWLISVRASHAYEFLGGHHTTHLILRKSYPSSLECPICMSFKNRNEMLVYRCGHHACIACTLHYLSVKSQNGLWYNILKNAPHKDCPFCRYQQAFTEVTTV
jgi:hypothetical protein